MDYLSKKQAEKIVQITSSIFAQGNSWVMKEWDLDSGTERLTRGLTEQAAKKRLKIWRKEKVEELLRADGEAKAYTIKEWHENPSWQGEGVWQWAYTNWYTTKEDAEKALKKRVEKTPGVCEIFELHTADLPGHFVVA